MHAWWYKEHIVLNLFQLQRMAHGHKQIDTIFLHFIEITFAKELHCLECDIDPKVRIRIL